MPHTLKNRIAQYRQRGAVGKALIVYLLTGSIGAALVAWLVFAGAGC
ncbi:MAG: hypothetical protein ACREIT_06775 [Tepidisphaeraceae bacterium]